MTSTEHDNLVVVVCGGEGSRFQRSIESEFEMGTLGIPQERLSALKGQQKELALVGDEPLIVAHTRTFASQGLGRFTFLMKKSDSGIEEVVRAQLGGGYDLSFRVNPPGETLLTSLASLVVHETEPIFVTTGNVFTSTDYTSMLRQHLECNSGITIGTVHETGDLIARSSGEVIIDPSIPQEVASVGDDYFEEWRELLESQGVTFPVESAWKVHTLTDYHRLVLEASLNRRGLVATEHGDYPDSPERNRLDDMEP